MRNEKGLGWKQRQILNFIKRNHVTGKVFSFGRDMLQVIQSLQERDLVKIINISYYEHRVILRIHK